MGRAGLIGRRILLILATTLAVSTIVFLGVHQLPGNAFLGNRMLDEGAIAALMHRYNLDLPLYEQYVRFLGGLIRGDLGESLVNQGVRISPLLLREALVSAEVGVLGLVITIGLGVPLGILAAVRQNSWVDWLTSGASAVAYGMPNFVVASILVIVFAVWMYDWTAGRFFYELGWRGTFGSPLQLPIPAIALGLPYAGLVARLTRASVLDVLREDYVRTAYSKGIPRRGVLTRHVLRNALIPIVSILGPLALGILSGSVVVENIFGIPGLGKEFVSSISTRDYNIVIGLFTVYAALIGLVNLAVDIAYQVIDPRVRY